MKTTLYLMRHGLVHNPTQILYGRLPDFHLSEEGQRQADSAGKWLADKPLTAIYCSPMERAQETAGFVAKYHKGLTPQIDEHLIEVHTPYDGRPIVEMEAMGWEIYAGNTAPYEVPLGILERVHDFFEIILKRHAGEQVAAVSHGDVLVFSWLSAQGLDPEADMKNSLVTYNLPETYPATASIMQFTLTDSPRLVLPQVTYIRPY